ncbi:MAG: alkaline phosphatase D family protein [Cyanobacteria bacterium J06638_22]
MRSVASGDTTQNSSVLWGLTESSSIRVIYGTDPSLSNGIERSAGALNDPLLPVKFEINNLRPGTQYYYRFIDGNGASKGGTFRTAAPDGRQAGLRFGVSGSWRGELAPYPAIANADERDLDFFMLHGDTVYAGVPSPAVPKAQAETLEDYRLKHREVYAQERYGLNAFGDLRASTSVLATIDDHDVINDFSGGASASSDNRFPETTGLINDTDLYENGLQAFVEYNPIRETFYGNTGDGRTANERQLYRFNTYGDDAAVFVLDNHSFRDEALPEPNAVDLTDQSPEDAAVVAQYLAQTFDPTRTLLGEVQLEDLKRDLLQAEQDGLTWKFIMLPEPIQNLGLQGSADRYEGYAAERAEILAFITENDIDNVVFVASDTNGTLVNNLTYQTAAGAPQIATSAFEITTGSVAFSQPFGPFAVNVAANAGLVDPFLLGVYNALPVAPDPTDSSFPDDKDDALELVINEQLQPLGYDPLGLDNNLPVADGLINASLLQGDYVAVHTYGWTEFEIDPVTQVLRVTTYGIDPYEPSDVATEQAANNAGVLNRIPRIVSQFEVTPQFDNPGGDGDGDGDGDSDGDGDGPTPFDDVLVGTAGDDIIFALAGNDRVSGLGGSDRLAGDEDNDTLLGGEGNDRLLGGAGNDTAVGGVGNDRFLGGNGSDRLSGNAGNDRMAGGNGADNLVGGVGNDTMVGGAGNDRLLAAGGNDLMRGNLGNDRLNGGSENDRLFGGPGNDRLNGQGGDDVLRGGTGRDVLRGGSGNDRLIGEIGNDLIVTGDGRDRVTVRRGHGLDRVRDFADGLDKILLAGIAFGQISIRQQNNDVLIATANERLLLLLGTRAQDITQADFA